MKIDKNILTLAMVAIGAACLAAWLLLPVLSFNIVIPLFGINGLHLALNVSNLTMLCLVVLLAMTFVPLTQNKMLCIITGVVSMVMCIVVLLLREAIITHGNLGWLYTAASLLITNIGSMFGETITAENIGMYIKLICDQFLVGGLGMWGVMGLSLIYIVAAALMSDSVSSGRPVTGSMSTSSHTRVTGSTTSASKGFTHRT